MKVCLIGNNLTSLILGYILSKKKIYSEIYSKNNHKYNFKTRTLGISEYNLKYLTKFFKNIPNHTKSINEIEVLINNEKINKKVSFNENSKVLFNMIKYDKIVSLVRSSVTKSKYISFKKIKKNSEYLSLNRNKKFYFIINCEKSNILTSKFLKTGIFKNYKNMAFTTIIKHEKIKNDRAIQIFTKYGPIAYLPLSEKSTSVVFSYDFGKNKNISENKILELIKQQNTYYKIKSNEKFESFRLSLRFPKKYYKNNILFFGDSIHSIHPLAGQGFNMTIRDIIKLDEMIDKKLNLGLNLDKDIFRQFENDTKSYNSIFSVGIDFIHEFFKFNNNYIPKNLSEKLFTLIDKNQKLKSFGIRFANQGNFKLL